MPLRTALRILAFGLGALFLSGCRSKDAELMFSNVGAEEIVSFGKPAGLGPVTGLRLRVDGRIEGSGQLTLLLDGKPHQVENLSGIVNIDWRGDWYEDRARLRYVPGPGVSGSLRVRYRFYD